jgi:hypothetical protein
MKILHVNGDADYGALTFEQDYGLEKAREDVKNGNVPKDESGDEAWEAKVLEFGEVDSKFIDFIKGEIMDYDMSKHENFYVL